MNIKIFVCYHKFNPIIANEILQPIFLGVANAKEQNINELEKLCNKSNVKLLYDNTKDNISHLNPYFCELTAMYWIWKNAESSGFDADYYGLFHYRRVFDFTPSSLISRFKQFLIPKSFTMSKYRLDEKSIINFMQQHNADIFIPIKRKNTSPNILYDNYAAYHHIQDLDLAISYIKNHYPFMKEAVDSVFFNDEAKVVWGNMAIIKKELYFEYCNWIFSILFGIMNDVDYKNYDDFQKRVFGFLSERLFNVWLYYKKQNENLKIVECKTTLLYERNKKFFGVIRNYEFERFYIAFIRVYKRRIKIIL